MSCAMDQSLHLRTVGQQVGVKADVIILKMLESSAQAMHFTYCNSYMIVVLLQHVGF